MSRVSIYFYAGDFADVLRRHGEGRQQTCLFYNGYSKWWLAGLLGALIGTVWNYVVSATFVWRP